MAWDERVLLLVACAFAALSISRGIVYNPCQPLETISRGDSFALGLAIVPAINTSLLANLTQTYGGLCNISFQNELVKNYNASVAIYNLRVDRLQVLRMPYADLVFSMVYAQNPTLALVAFRANVSSPPIYIASADDTATVGAGFVVSASLLLRFDAGTLQYLQWYDSTCNECGGIRSQLCINSSEAQINACATPLDNCTCSVVVNEANTTCSFDDERFDVCSTAINSAWLGTDRHQAAMRTGPQVQRLNAYSITSLFNAARDKFSELKDYVYTSVSGSWDQITSNAQSQYVDFEGGLAQYQRSSPPPPPPPSPPSPTPSPPPAPPPSPRAPPPPAAVLPPPSAPPPSAPPPSAPPPSAPPPSAPPSAPVSSRRLENEDSSEPPLSELTQLSPPADSTSKPLGTPTDTPTDTAPSVEPAEEALTNAPTEAIPTNTPTEATPTDTPTEETPTDTPAEEAPTDTATEATPTDTATEASPTDKPAEATPINTVTEAAPTNTLDVAGGGSN